MHSAFCNKGWPPEEKTLAELYPGPHRVGGSQHQCVYPPILGGWGGKARLTSEMVNSTSREFPGSPVVRTPFSHCQGPGFNPWLGN